MNTKKQDKKFRNTIAQKVSDKEELHQYEDSFRRWLSRELHSQRKTIKQAMDEFGITYNTAWHIMRYYTPEVNLTLPVMTEAEKLKLEKLQKRIKELEHQLEDAQIKNITLETLVDVAEKEFKIPIRKKPGAKQ